LIKDITNAQQTPAKMDVNNDIQDLCDKLRLCLLVTEDDEAEENTGIHLLFPSISLFFCYIFYDSIISYNPFCKILINLFLIQDFLHLRRHQNSFRKILMMI